MRVVVAAIVTCAGVAHADRLVLPEDQVEIAATLEVSLATAPFAQPTSIAPDLWWGVTPRLTIGVIHSHASVDQIDAGASFCVRTAALGCDKTYRGSGLDAHFLAYADGAFEIAPRARLLIRDLDPVKPAITLGAAARWRHGRFSIDTDPFVQLPLANNADGNRAQLWLPVYIGIAPACAWRLAVHTGWDGQFYDTADTWHVPVALQARFAATGMFDITAEAGFSTLLGPQNNIKQRAAMLTVAWHD